MSQTQFRRRTASVGALGTAAVLLWSGSAAAKSPPAGPSKRAVCTAAVGAYKQAVEESKAGHVRDAITSLASCIEATACTGLVPKCTALSTKLAEKMSSIVPVVLDEKGTPVLDAQVQLDGRVVCSRLDGLAVLVEPGAHDVTFSNDKGVIGTQKVLVLEGQRDRPVTFTIVGQAGSAVAAAPPTLPAAHPKPAPEESPGQPSDKTAANEAAVESHSEVKGRAWAMPKSALPYVLGGVGLAGLAAGGLLNFWGNKDTSDLENTCNPNCKPASLDHVKTMYVAADISLGVGAAALAVTTFLFATSHSAESGEKPATREGLRVVVDPTPSGGFASVSGAF